MPAYEKHSNDPQGPIALLLAYLFRDMSDPARGLLALALFALAGWFISCGWFVYAVMLAGLGFALVAVNGHHFTRDR